jgi:hypothetical protein
VQRYRWGKEEKDVRVSDAFLECYRPMDFLQNFNIVDTPGTNSVVKGHQEIIERFLPVADFLLFVFPVSNPWGAATWDFVSKLSKDRLGKVAFILSQKDLREAEDLNLIVEHLKSLAIQKIGASPPIFPVSGRLASEAKLARPFSEDRWKKSGYPALGAFISKGVAESPERRQVLEDVRDFTQSMLRVIEQKIEERTAQLDLDQYFLRELEAEVDIRREKKANDFAQKFHELTEVFMMEARESVEALERSITIPRSLLSLFRAEHIASELESELSDAVRNAVEERAGFDGQELVVNCREHWDTVVPRIKDRLQVPIPDFDEETNSLASTCERFAQRLGRSSRLAVANLKIRGSQDQQMENRRCVLRRYLSGVLCAVITAGILGALAIHPWSFVALGVGAIFLIISCIYAKTSKTLLCKNYVEKIESCRQPFVDSLSDEYKDGIHEFYLEYAGLFENVRRHIAEHKLSLGPKLERWNDLFLELKAIEQEI